MSEEKNLRDLLLKATREPLFRERFLKNPEAVAKECNVKLKPEYLDKIKRTAAFIDSLNDIRLPPGPIFYPVDPVLNNWRITELTNVLRETYLDKIKWIFYPADILNAARIRERELQRM